jgi:hypothetical protein
MVPSARRRRFGSHGKNAFLGGSRGLLRRARDATLSLLAWLLLYQRRFVVVSCRLSIIEFFDNPHGFFYCSPLMFVLATFDHCLKQLLSPFFAQCRQYLVQLSHYQPLDCMRSWKFVGYRNEYATTLCASGASPQGVLSALQRIADQCE